MFIDRVRQDQRRPLSSDDEIDPDEIAVPESNPEFDLEKHLTQERLQQAFSRLNADQRALVALHDIEGYTLVELESILDAPIGTLKSRLHRARKQLKRNLE